VFAWQSSQTELSQKCYGFISSAEQLTVIINNIDNSTSMCRPDLTVLLGRPTFTGKAWSFYPWSFFYFVLYFLIKHRAQQPSSRWPSNTFRRFDRR